MSDILGNPLNLNLGLLLPELILAGVAVLVVFIDMFQAELKASARVVPVVTVLGLLAAGVASVGAIDRVDDFAAGAGAGVAAGIDFDGDGIVGIDAEFLPGVGGG